MSGSTSDLHRPTLLLAEDHVETGNQLRELLQPHFDVVALVTDGRALLSAAAALDPDAIVTDIAMPLVDGIQASVLIRSNDPDARIIFVTVHSEPILVQRCMAAGALGYVLKDAAGDELVTAVHAALAGKRYVSRALRLHGQEEDLQ